jgi:chemotaxis protein CheC
VTVNPAVALGALELDALTELVNLGVSRSAGSLRTMVGAEVLLSVPSVEIVTHARAAQIIGDREPEKLVAVHQVFEGELTGRALLIFPEANSLELVRAVTGGALPLEDIIDLESEALAETGNIILNGCLATIANMLQRTLHISLPEILHGTGIEIFDLSSTPASAPSSEGAVLFLYINFSVKYRNIQGYIAVLMDMPSLTILKTLIGNLIKRASGDSHGNHAAY